MTLNTRTRFLNTLDLVLRKALVVAPIAAEDCNAGQEIVQHPEKNYGETEDSTLHKDFIAQGYNPAYGTVGVLFKTEDAGPKADYTDREFVVAGYASPQVIDRERHVILKEAMEKDLPRFLGNPLYANAQILHSNVQVGQVLPEWTHPVTKKVYKTQVDDIGLFCVIRVRTDKYRPKIVDKVIDDILANKLKSFSISGDAPVESRQHVCKDGECFWIIPEIEFYEFTLCEEGVNQDAKMVVLNKACSDGMCGVTAGAKAMAKRWFGEQESTEQLESANTIPEGVRDRANEVASHIGEEGAVQMVKDAQEAARKLENTGIGGSTDGDANTMSDFAQPYTSETAKAYAPDVEELARQYIHFAHNGGSPEDIYFKMLQDGAPSWFGTKSDNFRQFLVRIYRAKAPVPSIKLRIAGTKMGEMVKDPSNMTAFDLLQTALGNPGGSGGDIQKDVSSLLHEHESGSGKRKHASEQPRGHVDERGIAGYDETEEPESSEEYYLNLALKALNKDSKPLPHVPHGGAGKRSHNHPSTDPTQRPGTAGESHVHPQGTHAPLKKAAGPVHGGGTLHSHSSIKDGKHAGFYHHAHEDKRHGYKTPEGAKITVGSFSTPHGEIAKHKGPGIKPHPHGHKKGYRSGKRFRGTAPQAEENPMHTHAELGGLKHRHPRGDAPHTHTSEGGILFKAKCYRPRCSRPMGHKSAHTHDYKKPIKPPPHHSASASIHPTPRHDLDVVRNGMPLVAVPPEKHDHKHTHNFTVPRTHSHAHRHPTDRRQGSAFVSHSTVSHDYSGHHSSMNKAAPPAPGKKPAAKPKIQPKATVKPVAPDLNAPAAAGDPLQPDIGPKNNNQGKINVPAPGRRRNFMRVVKSIQDKPISQQNDFPSDKGTTYVGAETRVNNRATSEIISPTKETEGDGKLLDTILQMPPGITNVAPPQGIQGKNVGSSAGKLQVVNEGVAMNPQADIDERGAVKGSGSVS